MYFYSTLMITFIFVGVLAWLFSREPTPAVPYIGIVGFYNYLLKTPSLIFYMIMEITFMVSIVRNVFIITGLRKEIVFNTDVDVMLRNKQTDS
jgi:hypothetical protein